jgi:cell division protein FtsI (penicillin-binding protein 3)
MRNDKPRAKPTSRHSRIVLSESTGKRAVEQGRMRLLVVVGFFVLCFGSISARLVEVTLRPSQNDKTQAMSAEAQSEALDEERWMEKVRAGSAPAARGEIIDRNGVVLATSLKTASLFANPRIMNDKEGAIKKLTGTLPLDAGQLRRKLTSDKSFVWIKRNLTPVDQQRVNSLGIPGLYFEPEERRVYPYGAMLSHVLGYVGVDNSGLAGIERYFDKRLRNTEERREPLQLSIDLRVQNIVREEMAKAVEEFQAIGATGAVLDLATGELLALSNLPDFDPHYPARASDIQKFNRASLGAYEMGSTFKSFTAAMALDYGTVDMHGGYDTRQPIHISRFTITDSHPENRWLSVPEIFAYSSNIGTVKMIMDVGAQKQQQFLQKIGMMKPVEIELPELTDTLYPKDWKPVNMMTIAYGHGMAVSPLHLIQGIGTLMHDGRFMHMTLVKDGNKEKPDAERVISQDTVNKMRRLFRLVVEHGTGKKGEVEGYRVGGKTGTAEKVGVRGGYNAKAKLASFISVFPTDNPKYLVLVMMDEPRGNKSTYGFATGGWVSAPVAHRIISRMGALYGIAPDYNVPVDDDLERYWVKNTPPPAPPPAIMPAVNGGLHAVSY